MTKFCVQKPYTVLVAIVMVLVLGYVSFTGMQTELLPNISLPYLVVVTTYPGASPEKVESAVTEPMESALGTVNGVENVTSTSAENYSMVMLEFADGTDMDSAMVKVSSQIDQINGNLPELCGTPIIMEVSMDMMATMYVSVDYEGMDIYELTDFVDETVQPYFERQAGVARITPTGMVEKTVEVRLNQGKIDRVNDKMLIKVSDKLADAYDQLAEKQGELNDALVELADGQAELNKGKEELEDAKKELEEKQKETAKQLAEMSLKIDEGIATVASLSNQVAGLQASQAALQMEQKGWTEAKNGYESLDAGLKQITSMLPPPMSPMGIKDIVDSPMGETLVDGMKTVLTQMVSDLKLERDALQAKVADGTAEDPDLARLAELNAQIPMLEKMSGITFQDLKKLQDAYDKAQKRLPQIETELANLETEILAANMIKQKAEEGLEQLREAYKEIEAGQMTAAAGFGSGDAQIAAGESQLESAQKQLDNGFEQLESGREQLDDAWEQYYEARAEALESANLDQLLNMETISKMITAQNFSMPAGYIKRGDEQFLIKVGDTYVDVEDLTNTLLCDIEGIGEVRIRDVADVTIIDNAGDSYAKVNGNSAVVLSIFKASTSGTSEVSKSCLKAMKELEERYPGLRITVLVNQGDYIALVVDNVLSNLIEGAVLAILVLLLFLLDVRPTAVVAISIPFSVLSAIVLMYFTNITLNIISLGGLALGIGMLVDNSIVVIENIYRLRSRGVPAPRAAVQGAKQVAGAIIASTATTVCVFLPLVFASGLTRELLQDMGLTIAYSLIASLVVALSVVPAMSSTVLKNCKEKQHPWFDRFTRFYGKTLRFCLRFKIVPLALSIALLAFSIWEITRMGMILIPEMGSNQVSVSITMPEGNSDAQSIETADAAMTRIARIQGIDVVGAMASSTSSGLLGGLGGSGKADFSSFDFYITLDNIDNRDIDRITDEIKLTTADLDCDISISNAMDMSSLMTSGMQIDITGNNLDTLLSVSEDVMHILEQVDGFEDITNGQEDGDNEIRITVNKDAAMRLGLTVAQVYGELSSALTTSTTSTTLTVGEDEFSVEIVDETQNLSLDNIMDYVFETSTQNDEGETVKEKHRLSEFATQSTAQGVASIRRANQGRTMSVSATTKSGYNTTLLSREVERLLADYTPPEGYTLTVAGESSTVMDMVWQMIKMISLALIFIYLVMVLQFQSLLSPFIVIFTIPLAFTGGLFGMLVSGELLSLMSLMGFLVLAGVVVNNGIVFVDYTNQLRLAGLEKRDALVATGVTRMRPIFMTALTTVLSMSVMAMSTDATAAMSRGMAIVVIGGLLYATLMTLYIVPVMYDIFFRKKELKVIDVGDDLDESMDEAAEFARMQAEEQRRQNGENAPDADPEPEGAEQVEI